MHEFLISWLPITITGPDTIAAGSVQEYTTVAPANTTVLLETDVGVINRSRVTNGRTFTLDTTGLEPGETVTIKAGYKFWAGASKKIITLS
jgi:hypothetical protein